jgi:predicted NACHT family NTPase
MKNPEMEQHNIGKLCKESREMKTKTNFTKLIFHSYYIIWKFYNIKALSKMDFKKFPISLYGLIFISEKFNTFLTQ